MHFVVSSTDYPPLRGGIARYSYHLALALAKTDRVTVLSAQMSGGDVFDRGQPFTTVRVPNVPGLREVLLLRALLKIHRAQPIDWVLSAVWFPCGLVSHLALHLAGIKYLIVAHGSEIFDDRLTWKRIVKGLFMAWKQRMLEHATLILPTSRYTRDQLLPSVMLAPMVVLNPGVDIEMFRPAPKSIDLMRQLRISPDACVLLSVGRLDLHKGHDVTMRALSKLRGAIPQLAYVIVGDGPERGRLEALAGQLGLATIVRMVGPVEDSDLATYYNLCDLFVMPSRQMPGRLDLIEGFGIAFLEAAACGKPVIAGNSGGVADAVLHGQTGLLVDPLSAEAVADAVQRLHRDPEQARRLGQGGRRRCEEELNWPNVASTLRARLTQVRTV